MATKKENRPEGKNNEHDDNEMNKMSPDERIAWLRERGVQIETPEERKRKQVIDAMRQADQLEEVISYVLVPADSSKPLQELTFICKQNGKQHTGDQLIEHLKPAFRKKSGEHVDVELLKEQATQTLAANTPTNLVSDATLQQVAAEANVETFTLVHPIPSNNFTSINIYLDEVGMLKRLPLNKRAANYALAAGFNPPPSFYGDVFLGRVKHKPTITNLSFSLPDTSMDADWIKAATTENLEYQLEMNKITGRTDRQPLYAGSDGNVKQEDGYTWTQTEEELEVSIVLPPEAVSKAVQVQFRPQSIEVKYEKEVKLFLSLFERVEVDSCTWTLETGTDQKNLVITLEKSEQALWPRIRD